MKMIVGLGNPGMEYVNTRHNVGFSVVNKFAKNNNFKFSRKGKTLISENNLNGEKLIIIKPLTYMNLSGNSVESIRSIYKTEPKDILVIFDDMDLPCGKLRVKAKGSAGGHNGIKSIISCIGTQEFPRIKIGIGRDENAIDFVLGKFSRSESKIMEESYNLACDAINDWLENDIAFVMNKYNGL